MLPMGGVTMMQYYVLNAVIKSKSVRYVHNHLIRNNLVNFFTFFMNNKMCHYLYTIKKVIQETNF